MPGRVVDVGLQRLVEVLPERARLGLEELLDVGDVRVARALAAREGVLAGQQLIEHDHHDPVAPLAVGGVAGRAADRDLGAAQRRHQDLARAAPASQPFSL